MLYNLWEKYRVLFLTIGICLFVIGSFFFYTPASDGFPSHPMEVSVYASEKTKTTEQSPLRKKEEHQESQAKPLSPAPMYVDVKGSVKNPGVYILLHNERTQHIVVKAGGFLPAADLQRINLAQPLTDGMLVYVPAKGEHSPCNSFSNQLGLSFPASSALSSSPASKVHLNTATLTDFMTLPGIGETRAQIIIAYREKNGLFTSIEQLKNISGIGEKTFNKLKSKLTVD